MNENKDQKLKKELAEKILDALGLYIAWVRGSTAGLFVDTNTHGIVLGIGADGQEIDIGIDSNSSTIVDSTDILALDAVLMVKSFAYDLDCRTMAPKKMVSNPFFGLKSYEEIAVQLDLLSGSACGEGSDD